MKTYAITGVATGIGAALARQLKQDGHQVIGFDIVPNADHVDALIQLDLVRPETIAPAIAGLNLELDGLCNNAGIPPKEGAEAAILQINYLSQRQFTRAILNKLKPGGAIVNIASRAGHGWRDNIGQVRRLSAITSGEQLGAFIDEENIDPTRAYNLSKEAMILWTMAEAEVLVGRNLRMNSVSPGAVATGILDDFARAFGERMARNVARAGRPASAEDVAKTASFLLSDQSAWLKGIDIPVDGGMGAFAASDMMELGLLSLLAKDGA